MSFTHIPAWMRRAVVYWHGTHCLSCGVQTIEGVRGPTQRHLDHVIPECDGGPTWLGNLQVLCRTCHLAKGTRRTDYRRPNWFVPPVHLAEEVGGCDYIDGITKRPLNGRWRPPAHKVVTTRDPFAVTCFHCKQMPKMLWFAREWANELAALRKSLADPYLEHASLTGW